MFVDEIKAYLLILEIDKIHAIQKVGPTEFSEK